MKVFISASSILATLVIFSTAAAAEAQEPGWWTPAWVQTFGSVGAVLLAIAVGVWQFRQSHDLAKAQRESEDQERKLKARSLALALVPELFEMQRKIEGARSNDGTISIETLDIPPILNESVDRLYLLGTAGAEIQQFIAVTRQFNQRVEHHRKVILGNQHAAIAAFRASLNGPLTLMERTLADALELIAPIHD